MYLALLEKMGNIFLINKAIRKGAVFPYTVFEETLECQCTLVKKPPIGAGPNIQANFLSD
jgi:hypothetical protein